MIFGVARLIHCVRRFITPNPGNVLTTGTRAGVAMGARNDDGTSEFDDVRIELLRTQIGKAAASNTTVSDNDLRFYEASARKKQLSADLSNLGWYLSSRKNWKGDAAIFKLALELPAPLSLVQLFR